jgi:predicted nucleic acid-binding protein
VNRYLLDTNVISELRKAKPHGAVIAWLSDLRDDQIFLSVVTVGELQTGIEMTRQQDPAKAAEIEAWVEQVADSYQVLPMDTTCFREWARLMMGKPGRLMEDVMIAATVRVNDLIVATRNERDFEQLRVEVLNPFQTQ